MRSVTVRVPATTANIGPGFDTLGCALMLYDTISFSETEFGLRFTGCEPKYSTPDNLAYVAFMRVAKWLGMSVTGLAINIEGDIPASRGLGSSAALITAGAVAANAFFGGRLTRQELLNICNPLEGHPDNLAPALYGGLTASMMNGDTPFTVKYAISDKLHFTALIPPFKNSTHAARAILPQNIPFQDAVYDLSRLAVLLKGLETGDTRAIRLALSDVLHEPYRKKLIPGIEDVKSAALDCGAAAFYISGSGSACMCVSDDAALPERLSAALAASSSAFSVLPLKCDHDGAVILEEK